MDYVIGIVLALVVVGSMTLLGFDRDRAFYPTVMIVIAAYYILFAATTGSSSVLMAEIAAAIVFILLAVIGFKTSPWFVVVALAAHGIFDFFHYRIIDDPGVPSFWPGFCSAFDIVAAIYLAALVVSRGRSRLEPA